MIALVIGFLFLLIILVIVPITVSLENEIDRSHSVMSLLSIFLIAFLLVCTSAFFAGQLTAQVNVFTVSATLAAILLCILTVATISSMALEGWNDLRSAERLFPNLVFTLVKLVSVAGAALLIAFVVREYISNKVHETAYAMPAEGDFACPDAQGALLCRDEDLQDSFNDLIDRSGHLMRERILSDTIAAVEAANDAEKSGREFGLQVLFDDPSGPVLHRDLSGYSKSLEPPKCFGLRYWISVPGQCVARRVLKPANEGYKGLRLALRDRYKTLASDVESSVDGKSSDALEFVDKRSSEMIDEWVADSKDTINFVFSVLLVLEILYWITVARLMTVIICHLLARLVYNVEVGNVPVTLLRGDKVTKPISFSMLQRGGGSDSEKGSQSVVVSLKDEVWIGIRNSLATLATPGSVALRLTDRPLGRLLNQQFVLIKYKESERFKTLDVNHTEEFNLFMGEIGEGQALVILDQSRIVAYSESLKFRRFFCPKLFAFFASRFVFQVAHGPGKIILASDKGGFQFPTEKSAAVPFTQFSAFDLSSTFELQAKNRILDAYILPPHLKPDTTHFGLASARPTGGVLYLVRRLFMLTLPG